MLVTCTYPVRFLVSLVAVWLSGAAALAARHEPQGSEAAIAALEARLAAQEAELRALRARLDSVSEIDNYLLPAGAWDEPACGCDSVVESLPLVVEAPAEPACGAGQCASRALRYYVDYDNGFVIRAFNPRKHPFELKVNGWIQFRHHAFDRDIDSWTDSAGVTRGVRNRNTFDVERGRMIFSGFAVDQRLTYFLQLDGDSDGGETVDFFDYWWAWEFDEQLAMQMGKRKVPASRQWLLSARHTRFVDRPLACDFFRPERTTGVFFVGQLAEHGRYEAMVGNGYRTANLTPADGDNRLTFAATNSWDLGGDFGQMLVDYDGAGRAIARIGHSGVYSPQETVNGLPLGEADFVRLTDGTRLADTGALAPGATVSSFDVFLYGVDAAVKYRGWSANGEAFFRWIEDLQADLPLPVTSLFQRGFYVEGGRFLIAKTLDVNLRYSQVDGSQGQASEIAAGANWFPLDTSLVKISLDVSSIDGSPLQNTASDILVGDDGTLFRTQLQAEY